MKLTKAKVTKFKSIDATEVIIDHSVTVLVGQNESGKTTFLEALRNSRPAIGSTKYDVTRDYPRKDLTKYRKRHEEDPETVLELTFLLEPVEKTLVDRHFGVEGLSGDVVTLTYDYSNSSTVGYGFGQDKLVAHLAAEADLGADAAAVLKDCKTIDAAIAGLEGRDLNTEEQSFLDELKEGFKPDTAPVWPNPGAKKAWNSVLRHHVPKFLYFDDYKLLPGKVNLNSLVAKSEKPEQLKDSERTVLSLLRMADIKAEDLLAEGGYEEAKANLEGLSNTVTDQIFEYWTQNQELEVEFDVKEDASDEAPFNSGKNLYIRIRNRRHRVTTDFSQRSRGFVWFFSFIVWFESVKEDVGTRNLILLLDEPGLNLHAMAQHDLLRYIADLSEKHQIIYTTHSPFMVESDKLDRARLVEDRPDDGGTVVTSELGGSDPRTLFPLQAALGYTIAQNLFISTRNLLVEGPADLLYLRFLSNLLEQEGREGLRDDVTIVPVGGLPNLATFIALLGANELKLAVLHDFSGNEEQRLKNMIASKAIRAKNVLHYAMFRAGGETKPTDVEDLLDRGFYLNLFNGVFATELGGAKVKVGDLGAKDRIVQCLEDWLKGEAISLRPSGGFNHYRPANYLVASPQKSVSGGTLDRFEALFAKVNSVYGSDG